ncbi:DUF2202 domain-containing protein [Methanogenium sp. MK-MG]|uniref:DUF2202 domain-containing protein n=1 Tax=Methanogenium sp. MK-MG TaxID=2599926 RepID=UPI0013EA44E6|nr:DUF2202 domain-containing protein [Methanogenium sp. MK-MG]KAF1078526.1 hypothetical protein MKMG_00583 [Methanogenium sp. MK-MG]
MKILTTCGAAAVVCILILVMCTGCTTDQQQYTTQPAGTSGEESYATVLDAGTLDARLEEYPVATLSAAEESDLLYMQEEEKLARDVYAVFFETWGMQVFKNIGKAEQTHMDSVTVLIERYGLESQSESSVTAGVFAHPELQALYDDLVKTGILSPEDALRAAILVEETDIVDLRDAMSRTDNGDIRYVYENLMRGSENHLRAFARNLEQQGESYTPMVLTQVDYDGIVSTSVRPGGFS